MDCIFCRIINGEILSKRIYEDEDMIIINDINPQANVHLLLVPKKHYADIVEMTDEDSLVLARCLKKLSTLPDRLGLSGGFRLVLNKGMDAGQSVQHLHIHILGGEELSLHMGR